MRTPALPSPRRIAVGAGLALLAAGLTPIAASANPAGTNLVISEVYGGGGNANAQYANDFVELYNPTSSAISVAGWSVQYRSAAGTSPTITNLTGSVPAGAHYLVQQASGGANGVALPTPDATGTANMSGSNGVVLLVSNQTGFTTTGNLAGSTDNGLVDVVGFGTTPTTFETVNTGVALSNTTAATRNVSGVDTDHNANDFTETAPDPQNSSVAVDPDAPVIDAVSDQSFSVDEPITPFTVTASGGDAPYAWSADGLPAGLDIDAVTGEVSGTPTAPGTASVTVTVADAEDRTAQVTFSIVVSPAAGEVTPIATIQGTGATTPLLGQTVTTEGVVTAAFPTGGLNGFYIQTPGADTVDASDAIFVYGGTTGFTTYPEVGDSVEVTGEAAEFSGQTQIIANQSGVVEIDELGEVIAKTVVPGTDCALPGTACLAGAELNAVREVAESELFQPTAPWTATDVYDGSPFWQGTQFSSAFRGEIGVAANSDMPLVTPTEVIDAQATAEVADRVKYNNAHRIVMDDGSSTTYSSGASRDLPFPWFTADHSVRVGAEISFPAPVVFTEGFGTWRILPQSQIVGDPTGQIDVEQTRADNLAPQDVGGDVTLATFNVLNYFPTTGEEFVSSGLGTCSFYSDRAGNPITNNQCNPNGPRGAANDANLQRQQDKIVAAINTADADIVSLEELENSVKFGKDRDFAINALVDALNEDAGEGTWAAVESPATLPTTDEQDVIRNGFIYQPGNVALVGDSVVLSDESAAGEAFEDAREPLAQAFKQVGTADADAFAVIVNHFKSKGSGNPDPDGQGNANDQRIAQAESLAVFAEEFQQARDITRVFLAGDFNAYSEEDPIQVLNAAGYTNLESTSDPDEETYNFDGMVGSLDHVLANEAALADVDGVDIWDINGSESVYYEYSRFNSNATNLYTPSPFRSSDHSPEIVGINTQQDTDGTTDLQLLNINDFHGRIDANTTRFATTVEQLRAEEENTLFLSAGDNIGASLFASALAQDQPTIDVLNALELRSSAVGNHEFDSGFADLTDRVIPASDFSILGANVYEVGTTTPALEEYDIFTVDGVDVAVIGAVTETTPSLVSPAGIAGIEFGDPVEAVNRVAAELSDGNAANGEADVIIAEYHEGAGDGAGSTLEEEVAEGGAFADIVNDTAAEVDVIFTGHTHKQYAWDAPVPGEPGTTRPILQTGSYGEFVGQVVLELDSATGDVISYTQANVARAAAEDTSFARVAEVKTIVTAALAEAAVVGNQPIGQITDDITTAFAGGTYGPDGYTGGTRDDRSSESTLGGLVANALRDGAAEFAEPDLALTNSGGLRAELFYAGDTSSNPANTDGVVTFAEANAVLPFNNTVAIVEITGANLKEVLEQQWQTNVDGSVVTARPYAQLGMSDNVQVTADESRALGDRITSVKIDGELLDPTRTYTLSTLSFLATGGDNFRAFTEADYTDTGLLDAQLWRDYLAANKPLSPDFARKQVFATDLPASVTAGEPVVFQLGVPTGDTVAPINGTTLNLTSQGSPLNTEVVATLVDGAERTEIDTFTVTDGVAPIDLLVPDDAPTGSVVELVAEPSGTTVVLPVEASDKTQSAVTASATPAQLKANTETGTIAVTVTGRRPTGMVSATIGNRVVGGAELVNGAAQIPVGPFTEPGVKDIVVSYAGDARNVGSSTSTSVTVVANPAPVPDRADATVAVTVSPSKVVVMDDRATVSVTVSKASGVPTGAVLALIDGEIVGASELVAGKADITLVPFTSVGTKSVEIRYYGDATTKPASATAPVDVVKAKPRMKVKAPKRAALGKKATIVVTLDATGFAPTGTVTVTVKGKKVTKKVRNGEVTLKVRLTKPGANKVTIRYNGDDLAQRASKTVKIMVKRR